MADYSWQRHLIGRGAYADWVDRGRMRPTHRQWSWYPREVAEKARAEIVAAEVTGLEADGERWRLAVSRGGDLGRRRGRHRRGAADPRRGPARPAPAGPRWAHLLAARAQGAVAQNACVIGSGETAASVVISLLGKLPKTRRSTS